MARMMTELELLGFYEMNRRLSKALEAEGRTIEAQRLARLMEEIEKGLYGFQGELTEPEPMIDHVDTH